MTNIALDIPLHPTAVLLPVDKSSLMFSGSLFSINNVEDGFQSRKTIRRDSLCHGYN